MPLHYISIYSIKKKRKTFKTITLHYNRKYNIQVSCKFLLELWEIVNSLFFIVLSIYWYSKHITVMVTRLPIRLHTFTHLCQAMGAIGALVSCSRIPSSWKIPSTY